MELVKELVAAHPGLVAKLRRFSYLEATRLAASLGLFPELHAQTIRIEMLQHLVATCCDGRREPQRDDLAEWAGKHLTESSVARNEDPLDDVFVGCVNSPFGSFRLLMGILADADFWLERALAFLADNRSYPPFEMAVVKVLPLLKLSDALVARIGLKRYAGSTGARGGRIKVCRWRELQPRVAAASFSDADLRQVGMTRAELAEFLITSEDRAKLINEDVRNSTLERRPLVEQSDGITVAMPSILGRSALRFMMELITHSAGGWADMIYQAGNASIFVNKVASRLGITPVDFEEPARPDGFPPLFPFFGQFDVGKPAILLTYCPSLVEAAADLTGCDQLSEPEEKALESHLRACAASFERLPEFSGGLVLVSVVGGLRTNRFELNEWSCQWRIHACSLPDWLFITSANQCSAMRLWKLGDHEAVLNRNGTELLNPAGLPNLFAAWKSNGFRITPRSKDARGLTMVNLDCAFAADLRIQARRKQDAHCLRSHDGKRWVCVSQRNAEPLFTEDAKFRMYIDPEAVRNRQLVGCVEEVAGVWWVVLQVDETTPELRSLAFQLWDCVFKWVARLTKVALCEWPSLETKPSIEISLHLPNLQNWRGTDHSKECLPGVVPSIAAEPAHARIDLTLPEEFLAEFHTPLNIAERKIVDLLLTGAAALAGAQVAEARRAELLSEIVRNEDARYFHLVHTHRTEQLLAGLQRPRPLFVADEDSAFSRLGLAHLLGHSGAGEIAGLAACRNFLKDAVDKVWERIELKLKSFQRKSVVSSCLQQLDEIAREEESWDMTVRSQFALHFDRSNVYDVLDEKQGDRDKASLCNRLLIETAQYACGTGEGILTQADHLTLLAELAFLVMLAHHRDAISYGFIEPKLRLFANGEIEMDDEFYTGTFARYMTKRSQERSDNAAKSYGDYFPSARSSDPTDSEELDAAVQQLDRVFFPEFGFSVSLLIKLQEEFRQFAVASGQARGELNEALFLAFLLHCGFSRAQSDTFLNRFTLPIRTAWNCDLPPSCREKDVFPWRYRRQLSLLSRPLVEVGLNPRSWLVSVPMLEKGLSYFLGNMEQASFPNEFFHSQAVHRYIGDTVNKRGHEFTGRVASLVRGAGFQTESEVEVTKLGSSKKDGLGDIDVFAWDFASGKVIAIECKRLLPAMTVREVIQRLEDFRGNREERDSLGRHLRRIDWLNTHPGQVSNYTGILASKIRLVPLLVSSETVPMQFFAEMNFSLSHVVPYDDLAHYISRELKPTTA
jgi:hypothetical protein